MPDLPTGSSAAPLRRQIMGVATGGAMVRNDHDLEAVLKREMGDLRGGDVVMGESEKAGEARPDGLKAAHRDDGAT